jgi:hypothetical protein
VSDAAETDEPVESRELDDATDTGCRDDPFEDATEARRPVFKFSIESRLDVAEGEVESATPAVPGRAPGLG